MRTNAYACTRIHTVGTGAFDLVLNKKMIEDVIDDAAEEKLIEDYGAAAAAAAAGGAWGDDKSSFNLNGAGGSTPNPFAFTPKRAENGDLAGGGFSPLLGGGGFSPLAHAPGGKTGRHGGGAGDARSPDYNPLSPRWDLA